MIKYGDRILSWCMSPEPGAIEQARNLSKLPCLIGNVCLMPDTHEGYGMPIGGVIALEKAVCPNAIGVDIGCGMLAVKTNLTEIPERSVLEKIVGTIRSKVPLGQTWHREPVETEFFDQVHWYEEGLASAPICFDELDHARLQLGTLGGGNHFIEIQYGDDGHVWFMIHSGSRNLGKKVADFYIEKARELCKRWYYNDIVKNDLAFIPRGEELFEQYWAEMNLCLAFAEQNRAEIAYSVKCAIRKHIPEMVPFHGISIHHNYAAFEHHYGKDVIVHRKGATLAREGVLGIIPGSQGSFSYIVKGKGNEASLCSCSHGAGRKMSRMKAKQTLELSKVQEEMESKGIVHGISNVNDLDEAPGAYKDIDVVMEEQKDLVETLVKLRPLAVVKG